MEDFMKLSQRQFDVLQSIVAYFKDQTPEDEMQEKRWKIGVFTRSEIWRGHTANSGTNTNPSFVTKNLASKATKAMKKELGMDAESHGLYNIGKMIQYNIDHPIVVKEAKPAVAKKASKKTGAEKPAPATKKTAAAKKGASKNKTAGVAKSNKKTKTSTETTKADEPAGLETITA